jgi:hypothetical protein
MTDRLTALLYHEYMHVLVHFLGNHRVPVWLNEGLAEVAERQIYSRPLLHLQSAAEKKQLLGWETLSASFAKLGSGQVELAYEQSYSLVYFMIDRYSWHKMSELLEKIGGGQAWQDAVSAVYLDYGLDWPAILVEWQASLRR